VSESAGYLAKRQRGRRRRGLPIPSLRCLMSHGRDDVAWARASTVVSAVLRKVHLLVLLLRLGDDPGRRRVIGLECEGAVHVMTFPSADHHAGRPSAL
jgi:hypothetical protein